MAKPKQFKVLCKNPDNADLLEESESALDGIESAMTALAGYEDFVDIFDTLSDLWDKLKKKNEKYENIAAAEYRKEIEGLTRDYYRMVM